MIEFSDMNIVEKILTILFVVSIFLTIFSAFLVFSNESKEIKNKPLLREFIGGLDVFFTSKYLNETGKMWRIPFLVGVIYIIFWIIFFT